MPVVWFHYCAAVQRWRTLSLLQSTQVLPHLPPAIALLLQPAEVAQRSCQRDARGVQRALTSAPLQLPHVSLIIISFLPRRTRRCYVGRSAIKEHFSRIITRKLAAPVQIRTHGQDLAAANRCRQARLLGRGPDARVLHMPHREIFWRVNSRFLWGVVGDMARTRSDSDVVLAGAWMVLLAGALAQGAMSSRGGENSQAGEDARAAFSSVSFQPEYGDNTDLPSPDVVPRRTY